MVIDDTADRFIIVEAEVVIGIVAVIGNDVKP
jgi:hypothetical protein